MSSRKYRTLKELREERKRCVQKISDREEQMRQMRRERDQIDRDLESMGAANWRMYQIVASCSLWIARKELEGE